VRNVGEVGARLLKDKIAALSGHVVGVIAVFVSGNRNTLTEFSNGGHERYSKYNKGTAGEKTSEFNKNHTSNYFPFSGISKATPESFPNRVPKLRDVVILILAFGA
jgi:hypothetical protein